MVWYKEFNSVFFISLAASRAGIVGLAVKYAFRSKCKKCKCLCIEIDRDVEAEIEEMKIEHSTKNLENIQEEPSTPKFSSPMNKV